MKSYAPREPFIPCLAITDEEARVACGREPERAYWEHTTALIAAQKEIQRIVDQDPDVKEAFLEMVGCVQRSGRGHPSPGNRSSGNG